MIGQSDIRPQSFTINTLANGMSELVFYENITEIHIQDMDQNDKIIFEFEMYEIMVPQRPGLSEDISANQELWLTYAKGQTEKPLSDKEKIIELQNQINSQDLVMNELMFEIIPSIIGGV